MYKFEGLIEKIVFDNLNKEDFIISLKSIKELKDIPLIKSDIIFSRLIFDLVYISREILNFREYCKLIDTFAAWSSIFKNEYETPRLFKNLLLHNLGIGQVYPIETSRDLDEKLTIYNKLENFREITYFDIINISTVDLNMSKINNEQYQQIINIILECKEFRLDKDYNLANGIEFIRQGEYNLAIDYYKKCIKYFKSNDKCFKESLTALLLGNLLLNLNKFEDSKKYYEAVIEINRKLKRWNAAALSTVLIGTIYFKNKNFSKAIEYLRIAQDYYKIFENEKEFYIVTGKIGKIQFLSGEIELAMKYYDKSIEYNKKMGNIAPNASIYVTIGNNFLRIRNFEKAIDYYNAALEINNQLEDHGNIARTTMKLAYVYQNLNKNDEAIKYFIKAVKNYEIQKDWKKVINISEKIAYFYLKQKKLNNALEYLKKAEGICYQTENFHTSGDINKEVGNMYFRQANYDDAELYYRTALNNYLKEDIFSGVAESYYKIAGVNLKFNMNSQAIENCYNAIDFYKKRLNLIEENTQLSKTNKINIRIAVFYKRIGYVYLHEKYPDLAIEAFQKSLTNFIQVFNFYEKIDKSNNLIRTKRLKKVYSQIASTYFIIGQIRLSENKFDSAIANFKNVIKFDRKNKDWENCAVGNLKIGKIYSNIKSYDKAINFYHLAIDFFLKIKNWDECARISILIADIFRNRNHFLKVIETLEKAISYNILNKNWYEVSKIYLRIGTIFATQSSYKDALDNYQKAIEYNLTNEDYSGTAFTSLKIGDLFSKLGNHTKALDYYIEAKGYNLNAGDSEGVAMTNIKIGDFLFNHSEYNEAIQYFIEAKKYYLNKENWSGGALTAVKIGKCYIEQKEYADAENSFIEAIENDLKNKNWPLIANSYIKLANLFSKQEMFEKSINYFNLARENGLKSKTKELINYINIRKASILRQLRDWHKAIDTYNEIIQFSKDYKTFQDVLYFEIQLLKCLARIHESAGDSEKVSDIFLNISSKYDQLSYFWYKSLYYLIHEIFKSDLISKQGDHESCLILLENIRKRLESFLSDRKNISQNSILNLIGFRINQVELFISREKAFISEEKNKYDDAIINFTRCSEISKNLVSPRFKLDFNLYNEISKYYFALSKRVEFQKFSLMFNNDVQAQIEILRDEILPLFYEVRENFINLNQHLREKQISYEIILLEGKILELEGNQIKSYLKYKEALPLLSEIDKSKIIQFSNSLKLLELNRKGFPIENHFLRKPSLGATFIEYCNLPDIELKAQFFHLAFENLPAVLETKKEYIIDLKVELDENFFEHFYDETFTLHFCETGQKKQFLTDSQVLTRIFKFKIPSIQENGEYFFQIELLDKYDNVAKSKVLILEFNENFKSISKKDKKIDLTKIQTRLNKGKYQEIRNKIDDILEKQLSFESKFFLKIFQESIEAFSYYLDFKPKSAMNKYIKVLNRIDDNFPLISSENNKNLLELIKNEYLFKIRNNLGKYLNEIKKNSKLRKIHPYIIEIYNIRIKNAYLNNQFTATLQLTIACLERLMDKKLFEEYNYDFNNFNWELLESSFIKEYKNIFSGETGIPIEKIILKNSLEFQSAKCLLMVLNKNFLKYCQKNSKSLAYLRHSRNNSYFEHGTGSIDKKTAKICIELIENFQNSLNLAIDSESLLENQLEFIEIYLKSFHNKNLDIHIIKDEDPISQ